MNYKKNLMRPDIHGKAESKGFEKAEHRMNSEPYDEPKKKTKHQKNLLKP